MTNKEENHCISLQELQLETARALVCESKENAQGLQPTAYLQFLIDKLCELSLKDPLTGLSNRRQLLSVIECELDRVARSGETALLLLLDIDHFKQVNDTYGHGAGDLVLQNISQVLQESVRPMDTLVRFGGEEFAIILPACHTAFAKSVAERIRKTVESQQIPISPSKSLKVTISIGGAFALQWIRSTSQLWIDRADQQLYQSKSRGRNCVHIEEQADSTVSAEEKNLLFGPLNDIPSTWLDIPGEAAAWNFTEEVTSNVN